VHRAALTGQQFQSASVEPVYVLFEDFTHVKFYRRSLYEGVILEGARFDGFKHVDDWVPQRLVTATGPNPLPRAQVVLCRAGLVRPLAPSARASRRHVRVSLGLGYFRPRHLFYRRVHITPLSACGRGQRCRCSRATGGWIGELFVAIFRKNRIVEIAFR
jgi:hypothetical protein